MKLETPFNKFRTLLHWSWNLSEIYVTFLKVIFVSLYFWIGYYMYIETSSPRSYGDNAKLEFSVSNSDVGKGSCLTFYYHMYGSTINTLNVYNGNSIVFTKSRQQGYQWLKAKMPLTLQNKVSWASQLSDVIFQQLAISIRNFFLWH